MQPSFCRVPLELLPSGGLFVLLFHRTRIY
nr:MAG TPA: hypothetical protein [Caudoviricetes sp.]